MKKYNYEDLIEEIQEDIDGGIITLEDDIFVIRSSNEVEEYRPIIDYEYSDIPDGPCEKIRVSWVLKELNDFNQV